MLDFATLSKNKLSTSLFFKTFPTQV
jgi:hypothetical protein